MDTLPLQSDLGTLSLVLHAEKISGDQMASIVDSIASAVGDGTSLASYRTYPVRMSLVGPKPALERVRTAVMQDERLQAALGKCREVSTAERPEPGDRGGRRSLVLLVDPNPTRSQEYVRILERDDVDVCCVKRGKAALMLLQRTALPFEAVIVQHHLPDLGDAAELLERLHVAQRRCSIAVFDDDYRPQWARRYRILGAYRYFDQPDGPLQLISMVGATISETRVWARAEEPRGEASCEPPRILLNPEQAADRLRYVCDLSSLERDVALMVLLGHRDNDIAHRLGKSERTAKRHVGHVLDKAGIKNRASLWAALYRDGCREYPPAAVPELAGPNGRSPVNPPCTPTPVGGSPTNRVGYPPSLPPGC